MGPSDRGNKKRAMGVLLAASFAVGGLVACNQILGTDKYSDGEQVVDGGSQDGTTTDGNTIDDGGSRDSGADVKVIVLPPGAQPATWAHWKMPDRLLDAGPTTSYTVQGNSVLDNVTQLVWQASSSGFIATKPAFSDAKAVCDALSADSGEKWRVPTRIELVSLLDHIDNAGVPKSPTIDPAFVNTGSGTYWTSSPVLPAEQPLKFWRVNFNNGSLERDTTAAYVRCVKGGG